MASAIQAIIFDCFGVIITDGLEIALQRLEQADPEVRAFVSSVIRENNSGLIAPVESNSRIAEHLGVSVEEWTSMVSGGEAKNSDVLGWIAQLRRQYRTALLSNVGRGSLERRFTEEELTAHFDVVVVSAEVGMLKPDPEIYRLTARKLGVPTEACVFLDDRQGYIEGAVRSGMRGICYQTLRQAKGELEAILGKG